MADLAGAQMVGEAIATLLKTRRSLLAQEDRLGPVPVAAAIDHVPVAKLVSATPPASGLSITCVQLLRSGHAPARTPAANPDNSIGISLELRLLLASWASTVADELALMSWAMLELNRHPLLDRGVLPGEGWARGESIQLAPEEADLEQLLRLWDGFGLKYHLSALFRARVLRIGYGPAADALPVVATRLSFTDAEIEPAPEAAA